MILGTCLRASRLIKRHYSTRPTVVVQGGVGQLGRDVVSRFKENNWTVVTIDGMKNDKAHYSFVLGPAGEKADSDAIVEFLKTNQPDAFICAAGGWSGGAINSEDIFNSLNTMLHFNVHSAVMAGHIAARTLKKGGLLVFTGASAALSPTPGMIAYGVSKAATHHLVASLAAPGSSMPDGSCTAAILPMTLDTLSNRQAMPNADRSSWTPTDLVAEELFKWASKPEARPKSGSLVQIITKNYKTEFVPTRE